jgi:hypothetical protein
VAEPTLPEQFVGFAKSVERDGAVTYAAICRGVATDADLLALIEQAPPAQRRPNLLLAAVHFLLLGGLAHPLGDYYDTIAGAAVRPPDDALSPAFRDLCLSQRTALNELIATKSTQTNEVGRCAVLLPALCAIAERAGGGTPLSLLDVGTSAGLNLLFDRYGYTYRAEADGTTRRAGDLSSSVDLPCAVRSEISGLPALGFPTMSGRRGLDLAPVDACSPDQARWLLACLWPDALPRFTRLQAALELWRTSLERPTLVQGDMVDDLASAAAGLGGDGPLVVFHSWAAAYLSEARQRDLVHAVRALGDTRPVHHLYAEQPYETPGLPTPESPIEVPGTRAATALVHIGPDGTPERWGSVHPHGTWLRWFG